MSFLFGRARTRTNTLDLSKQAREHVTKLDVAGKVSQPPRRKVVDVGLGCTNTDCSQAEELAKVLSQMKLVLQGTSGMIQQYHSVMRSLFFLHVCA